MRFSLCIFLFTLILDISSQIGDADYNTLLTQLKRSATGEEFLSSDKSSSWKNANGASLTSRALKRALEWTMKRRDSHYGWGSDTPHTVLALSLAHDSWFRAKNLQSELVTKEFEMHLVLRMWKHKENPMTSGQVALNVMTIVSLCRNPRSFFGKDLVALLEHHENRMDFEVAFADLAACNAGRRIKRSKIRRLLVMISHKPEMHSVDTLSVVILALHCAQKQRRLDLRNYMNNAVDILLTHQAKDGSFASNLHSTAIALQALTASGLSATWNVTQAQQFVMSHQLPDGSFGNIFDTNAVLPLLAGKTLLDVGRKTCHHQSADIQVDQTDSQVDKMIADLLDIPSPTPQNISRPSMSQIKKLSKNNTKEMINMTYIIWIGEHASKRYSESFSIPKGTNFLQIMQLAAKRNEHFEFLSSKWGSGYYIHTLSGESEKTNGFWFWLLYCLPEVPVIGIKPDDKYIVGKGVTELIPKDGDIIMYWYHKI